MKRFKFIIHSLLLLTFPSLAVYPQAHIPVTTNQVHEMELGGNHFQNNLLSYDRILNLIVDLESGELEKRYSQADMERLSHFLAILAKQGVLPNEIEEASVLENDIQELLYGDENFYEYSFSFNRGGGYGIVPTIFDNHLEVILCRGWVQKKLDKAKKFVKKHKKAIIIGAVVAVAVVTVVGVVAAIPAACAAGQGAASAGSDKNGKDKSKEKDDQESILSPSSETPAEFSPALEAVNETSILKTTLEEHVDSFKEEIAKDNFLQTSSHSEAHEDLSFGEHVRNLGAFFAHETLDGVSELASIVPQLFEEIKDIEHRIAPEDLFSTSNGVESIAIENYEKFIAAGHEKIDAVFSTDQSGYFTSEAKDESNKFTIGILPPPGMLVGASLNINKFAEAGKVLDRAGFTKAGRALMKHSYREDSVFPKPLGNPSQVNEHGQKVLESILNHPERKVVHKHTNNFGEVIDIHAPGIGGVRFNSSGEMIGFLEP